MRDMSNLKRRWFRLIGLPDDIEVLNICYHPPTDEWQVLICSDEFPIVEFGKIVPTIDLVIETRVEADDSRIAS